MPSLAGHLVTDVSVDLDLASAAGTGILYLLYMEVRRIVTLGGRCNS